MDIYLHKVYLLKDLLANLLLLQKLFPHNLYNTKQEMEEIVPKEEKLREYLNEHYVGILIIYPSLMMMVMMMMIVRIRLVKNVLIKSHQSFILSFFTFTEPSAQLPVSL